MVEPRSPVVRIDGEWFRTPNPFTMDRERIAHLTRQRELEWGQMQEYIANRRCSMQFLASALDDATSGPCGRCSVCLQQPVLSVERERSTLIEARRFIRHSEMSLQLKKQWELSALGDYAGQFRWRGLNIPHNLRGQDGRVLSRWGEPVWGALVAQGKAAGRFDDELVKATVDLIKNRWSEAARVAWVTCIPSLRHPELVHDFARRLANAMGIPFRGAVQKTRETEPQKQMQNRYHQCHNLDGAFTVYVDLRFDLCCEWTMLWTRLGRSPSHPRFCDRLGSVQYCRLP